MEEIYIVGAARTPIGKFGGSLAKTPASDLGALVIRKVLERAGVRPEQVSEVIMGQVLTAGVGQNPARQAAIKAGLPEMIPSMTINKVCGSGLKAAMLGDGLWDVYNQYHMGVTAENVAKEYAVTREEQDEFAVASQQKTEAAQKAGRFKEEIITVEIPSRKGPVMFADDEYPRHGATLEAMKSLKPAFDKNGSVTAGNASGINDGAAAVVLASSKKVKELGLKPLVRIKAFASAGVDPKYMGMGPVPASKRTLSRAGWEPKELDLMEINEAFAAQAIAVNRQMGWDTKKVNVNGGAIALGHPIGASGCRILVTLLHEMQKRDARRGLASLCIGGGMGVALAVER